MNKTWITFHHPPSDQHLIALCEEDYGLKISTFANKTVFKRRERYHITTIISLIPYEDIFIDCESEPDETESIKSESE